MLLWTLLSVWGCGAGSAPEPEAVRYTRLVTDPAPDPDSALAACAALSAASLQGDCGLTVARNAAASRQEAPETYCDRIADPVWSAECYFMAAEDHNEDGDAARAAALCVKSALFTDHCSQHLWQRSLRVLTWRDGSAAFARALPRARRLYAEWAPLLAEETDFPSRFWRRYYEGGFERDRWIDISACDALEDAADEQLCRAAATTLYRRELQQSMHIPRAMQVLCASEPTSAALAATPVPQFRTTPAPELDAVVARFQRLRCTEDGEPRPDGGGPPVLAPAFDAPP